MKQGSLYWPLFDYLRLSSEAEKTLTFTEVEALLGSALPRSARASAAWWSNRASGVQAAAWINAEYRVVRLGLAEERVTFRKRAVEHPLLLRAGRGETWDAEAIRSLREYMGMTQTEMAEVLGVRQQTVSEWEKGVYAASRATSKHLARVAEEVGFTYDTSGEG